MSKSSPIQKLPGGAQGYDEREVIPKGTPVGLGDLEDGDPGGEYNHPQEEAPQLSTGHSL